MYSLQYIQGVFSFLASFWWGGSLSSCLLGHWSIACGLRGDYSYLCGFRPLAIAEIKRGVFLGLIGGFACHLVCLVSTVRGGDRVCDWGSGLDWGS